ncbi:MAG: hypothetical protein CMF55_04655 [Legionellales bacterium]|nr:hypothetical protein [Legionellales bacterium]
MPDPKLHPLSLGNPIAKHPLSELSFTRNETLFHGLRLVSQFNDIESKPFSACSGRLTPWIDGLSDDCRSTQSKLAESEKEFLDQLEMIERDLGGLTCYICKPSYSKAYEPDKKWIYIEGNGFGVFPFDINFRKSAWIALADQTNATVIVMCTPSASNNLVLEGQAERLANSLLYLSRSREFFPVARDILTVGYSSGATLLLMALNRLCDLGVMNDHPIFSPHFIALVPFVQPMYDKSERVRLYPKDRAEAPAVTQVARMRSNTPDSLDALSASGVGSYPFYFSIMCRLTPNDQGKREGQSFYLNQSHFNHLIHLGLKLVIHSLSQDPLAKAVDRAIESLEITKYVYDKSHHAPWCDPDFLKQVTGGFSAHLHGIRALNEDKLALDSERALQRKRSFSFDGISSGDKQREKRSRGGSLGQDPKSSSKQALDKTHTLFSTGALDTPDEFGTKSLRLKK